MCEGSFLPSSFGPHQKHTEFESSLRSYPIKPFRGFCERMGTFSRSRREFASRSFSAAHSSRAAKSFLFLPERLAREGRSDSTFRAMSHFPHFSSVGAEYSSPARERWLEISHDRVLQGRHNHVLCLRFRVFFAKTSSRGAAGVPHFSPLLR